MKIEIIKPTVAGGKNVNSGDVVDVAVEDYRLLIAFGFGIPFVEKPKLKKKAVTKNV